MYENLKNAMTAEQVTAAQIADLLGISEKSVRNKIAGKTDWTYKEVVKIKSFLFRHYDTDWLFDFKKTA